MNTLLRNSQFLKKKPFQVFSLIKNSKQGFQFSTSNNQKQVDINKPNPVRRCLFAKLVENGQGNKFCFSYGNPHGIQFLNFNYSTFWNDFSHYSLYLESQNDSQEIKALKTIDTPIDYSDFSSHNQENFLFANKEKFISHSANPIIGFDMEREKLKMKEVIKIGQLPLSDENYIYDLNAHIPQDFDLDVTTTGNITGHNFKDSKIVASQCFLRTLGQNSHIFTKRIKSEHCKLQSIDGPITIGSSLETRHLKIQTESGNITINKKLGITNEGVISTSTGNIFIGAIYHQSILDYDKKNLQNVNGHQLKVEVQSNMEDGLRIEGGNSIVIDYVQGRFSVNSEQESTYLFNTVEKAAFNIQAPQSILKIHIKSLSESSTIFCRNVELLIEEDLDSFDIQTMKDGATNEKASREETSNKPLLTIKYGQQCKVKKADKFTILKELIQQKILLRKKGSQ